MHTGVVRSALMTLYRSFPRWGSNQPSGMVTADPKIHLGKERVHDVTCTRAVIGRQQGVGLTVELEPTPQLGMQIDTSLLAEGRILIKIQNLHSKLV